jgi:hypothetical protein
MATNSVAIAVIFSFFSFFGEFPQPGDEKRGFFV